LPPDVKNAKNLERWPALGEKDKNVKKKESGLR